MWHVHEKLLIKRLSYQWFLERVSASNLNIFMIMISLVKIEFFILNLKVTLESSSSSRNKQITSHLFGDHWRIKCRYEHTNYVMDPIHTRDQSIDILFYENITRCLRTNCYFEWWYVATDNSLNISIKKSSSHTGCVSVTVTL